MLLISQSIVASTGSSSVHLLTPDEILRDNALRANALRANSLRVAAPCVHAGALPALAPFDEAGTSYVAGHVLDHGAFENLCAALCISFALLGRAFGDANPNVVLRCARALWMIANAATLADATVRPAALAQAEYNHAGPVALNPVADAIDESNEARKFARGLGMHALWPLAQRLGVTIAYTSLDYQKPDGSHSE